MKTLIMEGCAKVRTGDIKILSKQQKEVKMQMY